jgi:hypothetical protein
VPAGSCALDSPSGGGDGDWETIPPARLVSAGLEIDRSTVSRVLSILRRDFVSCSCFLIAMLAYDCGSARTRRG